MKKQGIGFLIWAGFMSFMTIYPFLLTPIGPNEAITVADFAGARTITSATSGMKVFSILGGIISIALCYLFFRIAKGREKRAWFARLPGYFFCGIGTGFPYWGFSEITRASFLKSRGFDDMLANSAIIVAIIGSILFSVLAYVLIFKNQKRTIEVEEIKNEENLDQSRPASTD